MDWTDFMDETVANIATLNREIPATVKGFNQMGQAAKTSGALDETTKEIMALGIAIATRCDSCIGFHVRALIRLGLSREALCALVEANELPKLRQDGRLQLGAQ